MQTSFQHDSVHQIYVSSGIVLKAEQIHKRDSLTHSTKRTYVSKNQQPNPGKICLNIHFIILSWAGYNAVVFPDVHLIVCSGRLGMGGNIHASSHCGKAIL